MNQERDEIALRFIGSLFLILISGLFSFAAFQSVRDGEIKNLFAAFVVSLIALCALGVGTWMIVGTLSSLMTQRDVDPLGSWSRFTK